MSGESDQLDKIDRKLDSIQRDVNDIQGDMRMLTNMNKETSKSELKSQIHDKFGTSTARKKIWLEADGSMTVGELAGAADVAEGTVRRYASEMAEAGVLDRFKDGNETYYARADITEGIGIEEEILEDLET